MKNISVRDAIDRITPEGVRASATNLIPPNSVLLVIRSGVLKHTLPVAINSVPVAVNQDMKALICNSEIDPKFLLWFLLSVSPEILQSVRGTTADNIPLEVLKNVRIPLPPLPEQRRIAAILDQADALRTKRRQALRMLDYLIDSRFKQMFGDPESDSTKVPFESQIRTVRYGTGSPPQYVDTGIPFIRATNIKFGRISTRDLKRISVVDAKRLVRCRLSAGNLIVVRSGVNTGDAAVVPQCLEGACAAYDLIVDLDCSSAVFYSYLINSSWGKKVIERVSRRAAQPHLNAEQLRRLHVIAPSLQERRQFASFIDVVDKQRKSGLESLAEIDRLFASLQYRAFNGEL